MSYKSYGVRRTGKFYNQKVGGGKNKHLHFFITLS
jgi:hypothetical protein